MPREVLCLTQVTLPVSDRVGIELLNPPHHRALLSRGHLCEPPGMKPARVHSHLSPRSAASTSQVVTAGGPRTPQGLPHRGQAQPPPTARTSVPKADVLGCSKGVWGPPDF